ncbi:MAG TPA: regulatory protein RecX [Acidisarcina sp.]
MAFNRPRKKPAPLTEPALYNYAVHALARRMRTVSDLKRLMRSRVEDDETGAAKISAVVARLVEYKFLDDTAYAADFTRLRQENEKFGKRRVQQELQHKGVASELISSTLDTAYANVPEEDLARLHIARKRLKPPSDAKGANRIVRQLMRAGFSPGVVFKILKNWELDEEALAGLESLIVDDPDDGSAADATE